MRIPTLTAAALLAGGLLAACSLPAPDGAAANEADGSRDILLVEQPGPESAGVSDLEAGRAHEEAPARAVVRPRPAARQVAEAPRVVAPEPVAVPVATLASAEAVAPAAAPAADEEPLPEIIRAPLPSTWMGGSDGPLGVGGDHGASGRGPGIIIRGGRGGIDDDCDLHRPRFGGTGIAINRRGAFPVVGGGMARPGLRGRIR